jgi:hypothetical protein
LSRPARRFHLDIKWPAGDERLIENDANSQWVMERDPGQSRSLSFMAE